MSALKSILFFSFIFFSVQSQAAWDLYKAGVSINGGYYDCLMNTAAPDFQHRNFGRYTTGGTITLNFSEVLTFKNAASNVCSANLQYRVYRTCDTPPAFSTLSLPFCCNYLATDCAGGACGPDLNNAGDQKWKGTSGANILAGLTLSGVYVIEVYYDATGDDAGGCTNTKYASNSSNNYRAYFELNIDDCFTDSDFTNPLQNGDLGSLLIVNNSTCSGLLGTEQTRTHTVKLNAATGPGSQYLSTLFGVWNAQQEWYFWIGRDNAQAATNANKIDVFLFGTTSNIESNAVSGYKVTYGDDFGGDELRLQVVTAGVATTFLTSTTSTANGLLDYGIAVKVTRSQTNVWTLYTSYLPQNPTETQATPTPLSCVETSATVNHGSATDGTHAITGSGYVGPIFYHSSGVGERSAAEFDNLRVVALPPNTELVIAGLTSGSANEDVANTGNLLVQVQLTNPSTTVATTVDLVITSGAAARVGRGTTVNTNFAGPYTTITLTWAANTSGVKNIYLDPDDNALCDDLATLVFGLQNATGGNSAFINTPNTYTASIIDDNMGYETLLSENFETGSITGWTTTGTSWAANTAAPITGTYSARHSTQAGAGTSSLAYPFDDAALSGIATTWRFQVKYQNDPSVNNNFQVFLSANEPTLYSATVDGYAVVIDQSSLPSAGTNDFIRLYRVTNGAYAAVPIINSAIDWVTNVNAGTKVGFEIVLNEAGTWNLKIDANGDFDALVSLGTGVDVGGGGLTYPIMQNFGMRFRYTAGVSDFMRFDDVVVSQKGCKELWYSQASGNVSASIWSLTPVGAPSAVVGGRYKRFRVQGSATGDNIPDNVTVNSDWVINDLSIDVGGTLIGGAFTTRVYGTWLNDGTYTEGTSNVLFKGQAAQSIIGASTTTFNNMTIDNDGFNVTVAAATNVKGVVYPNEGTLQTGGILTLLSTITGSASISTIQAASAVSGNITLQRYTPSIPWIYGNWVNLGCPIQGQTIADWNDDMITTGFIGSDYPAPYPFNNIRNYNEPTAGAQSLGYVNAVNVTDALSSSNGYFVWMQGTAQNLDNTGAIQTGTFNQSLSYTPTPGGILNDGWHLKTNAYPSEVDWNLVSSTFSVSNPRVHYVFDHTSNSYKIWNATSNTGTGSRYIPHSQSFLVKVNTVGQNLHYEETYKTNTGAAFERSYEESDQYVSLKLERNGMSDECLLIFNDATSPNYEGYDAFDLESPNAESVEMSLMSADNVPLAQDSRPITSDISIPVYLDLPEAGSYTFSVLETQSLPLGACLMVEDIETGNSMMLQVGQQMTIVTNAAYQGNRLLIHATAPVTVLSSNTTCYHTANGSIDVTVPFGNWSVVLQNEASNNETVANGSMTFEDLAAGIYNVIVNNGSECSVGTQTITIVEPAATIIQVVDYNVATCSTDRDGRIELLVENTEWFNYEVLDGNEIISTGTVEGNSVVINNLPGRTYKVNVYTNCSTEHLEVNLLDPGVVAFESSTVPEQITLVNGVTDVVYIVEANTEDVQWTSSNGQIGSGNSFNLHVTNEGSITVTAVATKGTCKTSKEWTKTVKSIELIHTESVDPLVVLVQLNDQLQFNFGNTMTEQMVTFELIDAAGRLVINTSKNVQAGQQILLPISAIASGIYNLNIQSIDGQSLMIKKIVK